MGLAFISIECPAYSGHLDPLAQSLCLIEIKAKASHHGGLDQQIEDF